ncbi:MAG: HAD family hydrolase [Crocinitomicaceae bacterium]
MMKMNFEAIIFDLGGVILNIDYHKTIQAFKNIGIKEFDDLYNQAQQNQLFDNLETGKISESDFYLEIQRISNASISVKQIEIAWNAMLLDLPSKRIDFLIELAKATPIYLLSNTNSIHLKAFQNIINESFGKKELLEDVFIETFYSHKIGLRKPHADVFQLILDKHQLNPTNTLFIDDSIQHIEGAKKIGLKTHHLVNQDIITLFD